jgi:dihydroorotate dehydrogenase (NAD+) catalytic subunit
VAVKDREKKNSRLKVKIGSIELTNPTILASGVLGVAAGGLIRAWNDGAAAVVTKTVGLQPRSGHPGPRIVGLYGDSLMNAMGIPNPGIEEYLPEIDAAVKQGIPVIGSALGSTPEEFAKVAVALCKAGVTAIELNVSCPHVGSLYLLGMDTQITSAVVSKVVKHTKKEIPVWVKLPGSTDYPQLVQVAKAAEKAGAAAVVALNTLPALAIDVESRRPLLGAGIGGLSGPAIKPIAIRAVWELFKSGLTIPIIGVGGILTGQDILEYFLAGATAVEIGTGVLARGSTIFTQVCDELTAYLKRHRIKRITQLTGRMKTQDVKT